MLFRGVPLLPSEYCTNLARVALRDHDFRNTVAYAQLGLGTAPESAAAPGQNDMLHTLLRKCGSDPKNPNLYFYLGEGNRAIASQMKNFLIASIYCQRADDAFKAGLKVFPQDESMLVRDAEALDMMQNYADAETIFQKAFLLDPKLDVLRTEYEKHLKSEGKVAEAEALARQRAQAATVVVDRDQAPGAGAGL